ncbi:uncharacterized protein CIMG_07043 [Coccidioides immitis RS]|uniref:Uncharacterized protein n=1 Tax=Coccidioides immitis (strain RS) TaxID=246410 RepID=J3K9I2_COCIM|nr:uncharacterized protein CIMG_07043 [Coccidioides immitis RS]EAS31564.3 hypothetical protein CIMG_07043 [Coccidioides immitis RS]
MSLQESALSRTDQNGEPATKVGMESENNERGEGESGLYMRKTDNIYINRSRVRRDGPHPETEKYQRSRVIQARRGKKRNINANAGGLVGWSGCLSYRAHSLASSNGFLEVWVVGRSGRRRDMYGCRTREIKVWAGRSVFMQGGGSNAVRQPGRCNWGESNSKRQEKKHEKSMQSLTGEDQQRRQQQQQKKKQLV